MQQTYYIIGVVIILTSLDAEAVELSYTVFPSICHLIFIEQFGEVIATNPFLTTYVLK